MIFLFRIFLIILVYQITKYMTNNEIIRDITYLISLIRVYIYKLINYFYKKIEKNNTYNCPSNKK